jgi:predicted nucleic acid-binding protein
VTLIVDASVVAKWVFAEDGSDRANALRHEPRLIAPSLLAAEVGNALWKAVRRGDMAREDAVAALRSLLGPFDELVPSEALHTRALELAIDLQHPIYDCFYLALAERENAPLVTADTRLLGLAQTTRFRAPYDRAHASCAL